MVSSNAIDASPQYIDIKDTAQVAGRAQKTGISYFAMRST